MKALIDGDILTYECGFAAHAIDPTPDWDLVENLIKTKINTIVQMTEADTYQIFLSSPGSFRHDMFPDYKKRPGMKPWHYNNIRFYFQHHHPCCMSVSELEADDELGIAGTQLHDVIICSRDKDLRQIPGWFYSWETRMQPEYGPTLHTKLGGLDWNDGKPRGSGYSWFSYQTLVGDPSDTYGGCRNVGPRKAFQILEGLWDEGSQEDAVKNCFDNEEDWKLMSKLAWIVRRYEDGKPQQWEEGLYE